VAEKSVTDKIIEQLIMPEDQKKGEITLDIYKKYIDLNGGWVFITLVLISMSMWLGLSSFANIWMEKWC
jgi:hypothetical protein